MIIQERDQTIQNTHCPRCGDKLEILIKLTHRKTITKTKLKICENKNCPQFLDFEKIKGWKRLNHRRYNRDFIRQNKEGYNPNKNRFQSV